ncbi:MAG: hypothetical protein IJR17_06045 [Clostridia bacterium]|nr:hypothetical protein [Clostridia bacterium]
MLKQQSLATKNHPKRVAFYMLFALRANDVRFAHDAALLMMHACGTRDVCPIGQMMLAMPMMALC